MKADPSPQRERRSLLGPDVDWTPLAKTLYEEKKTTSQVYECIKLNMRQIVLSSW